MPLMLGVAAAGGVGYYLYQSGGNVKVAEKQFESEFGFLSYIVVAMSLLISMRATAPSPVQLSPTPADWS